MRCLGEWSLARESKDKMFRERLTWSIGEKREKVFIELKILHGVGEERTEQ